MYADVVLGVDHYLFEEALEDAKQARGCRFDTELDAAALTELVGTFKAIVQKATGKPFPQDPKEQLWGAIGAVFGSWQTAARGRPTAGCTTSRARWAPPSTSRRWCSATWATTAPPASPSPAIRRPASAPSTASS